MKPVRSGYADLKGINLYHEIYGQGEPLVLIHGGLTTIGEMQVWVEWPEPRRFPRFLDKFGKMMSENYDWSAEIAKLPMPVLLVFADNDSISQKRIAEFFALLDGGVREPGWVNTQLSKSRLAVVPGYSHYNFITSPEVPQIIDRFLANPLTNTAAGAAAASLAAST